MSKNNKESSKFDLHDACEKSLVEIMGLTEEESILIVFDVGTEDIAHAFLNAANEITDNTSVFEIEPSGRNGVEPSDECAEDMKKYDVALLITTYSISHTQARKNATDAGVRVASMPGITEDILVRCVNVDLEEMEKLSLQISQELDNGSEVHIKTKEGTDLTLSVDGRICPKPGVFLDEKGRWSNIPGSEAYVAPIEGTANGTLVIDASIPKSIVKEKITVEIKNGFAVSIQGGEEASQLNSILESVGDKNAYNVAELGIGTNKSAKITGITLEDEKVYGTAHIAFGNNATFGGTVNVPVHLDCVFKNPTIAVDGKKIIVNGKVV